MNSPFHYWKPILKEYKKIKIAQGCYTWRWEVEDPETYKARKNNFISFAIFGKCISVQYRKYPKGFKNTAPAFSIRINLSFLKP